MNHDQFWLIVDEVCRSDPSTIDQWDGRLVESLSQLAATEIVEWNRIFDQLAAEAYRVDLWAAAYLINGGASDDGFYYFRCWLIGMGKQVYASAVANADSLADIVSPRWRGDGIEAEAEIYGAAHQAWMQVTGLPSTANYPARNEPAELIGDDWNFEDRTEMRLRLPRLFALYFDPKMD